ELLQANAELDRAKYDLEKMKFGQLKIPDDLLDDYNEQIQDMEHIFFQNKNETDQKRVKLRMDEIHHTLESLGFIFLAPLLSVSSWLLLVIGGTDNHYTFALVGFSVGLATERIINSMKSFIGEKLPSDEKKNSSEKSNKIVEIQKEIETRKTEPKFLTFDIAPKVVETPRTGINDVKVYGTIETTSDNQVVDITLTTPKGKEEKSIARYAETETYNVVKFERKYGIDKNKDQGTYIVRAVLRENESQVRSGTFEVR
ncbi:MAG: hypothetical protein ACREAE_08135, partial [Nitrosopumilaceae archaeon]